MALIHEKKDAAGGWGTVMVLTGAPGGAGTVPVRQADGTYQDQAAPGGSGDNILVDDVTGAVLVDDATGQVLYEG